MVALRAQGKAVDGHREGDANLTVANLTSLT
jgi:hypothetical protein